MDYKLISCILTVIVNHTPNWTKLDQRTLELAKVRCGQIYKNSPCLKRFIKIEEQRYMALCGKQK